MTLRVGLSMQPVPPVELTVAQIVQAEADGFHSVWLPDHLMGWFPKSVWTPENSPIAALIPSPHLYLDPVVAIASAASSTQKIRLGPGVTDPIRRPPAELARTFLSLAIATGGRAFLGIGAGERENIEPYGLDFSYQVSKLEESLHVIRLLWESREPVDFDGRFWKLKRAVMDLEPPDGVLPEIWVGAHGPRMLEITGRFADGWYPSYPMTPKEYGEKLAVVRRAAADAGRDPGSVRAGCQIYTLVTENHDDAHTILSSPLAAAISLVATAGHWKKAGKRHPLGSAYDGLRDYVPEWVDPGELKRAMETYEMSVLHDVVVHGTAQEVIDQLRGFVDEGLEDVALANMAPLGGLEFMAAAQEGLRKIAAAFA